MDEATKSEITVLLAALKQENEANLATQRTELTKEFEVIANKIHSSYAKQLKKAGIATQSDNDDEDAPTHKPTKRELEMQTNIEKLVRERDEEKAIAKAATQKQAIVDQLLKGGFKQEAVETVHKLFRADNLISEDAEGNLLLKVTPTNSQARVSLPIAEALKHYGQSNEGKLYLQPLGTNGSGAKDAPANKVAPDNGGDNKRGSRNVTVNWDAVSHNLLSEASGSEGAVGEGDGSYAPRFDTK